MRISFDSVGVTLGQQDRAYAEYRLFTAVTPHADVGDATVTLRRDAARAHAFLCVTSVDLGHYGQVQARGSGPSVRSAMDRAASRLAALLGRRDRPAVS